MDWSRTVVTVNPNTAIDCVLEVPEFEVGKHVKGRLLSRSPAGKGINVARALARLGRTCVATGFVGEAELDEFDRLLKNTGPGRAISQLLSVYGRTRQNITLLDPSRHTDTHVRDRGFQVTAQDVQRLISKVGLLSRAEEVVAFTGSLPPGMEVSDLRLMVSRAVTAGARVVVDADADVLQALLGPGQPSLGGKVWMLKPNRVELAGVAGVGPLQDEQQVLAAARSLTSRCQIICVTLGAQGAMLVTQTGAWRAQLTVDPSMVSNTVGCGDCAMAGLLDAYLRDGDERALVRRAVATGAANAISSGIAEFSATLVDDLEDNVQVQPLPVG